MGRGKCVYDAAPDTSPPSTDEAVVARGVWTKRLGQITPGCSGSQDPEDAIEDTTVVYPRNATRLVRQHRLDGNPFIISEFVAHDSSPQFGSLNHRGPAKRNAPGQAPVRLWGEADINQPATPAETVENDPEQTFAGISQLQLELRCDATAAVPVAKVTRKQRSETISTCAPVMLALMTAHLSDLISIWRPKGDLHC